MADEIKTTMYSVDECYLRGWYTLQELHGIINAMYVRNDEAQQAMRETIGQEPK